MTPRLMFVHAHPDDESSQSSATMAKYLDEGAEVSLVTCTLGEYGEIVSPDLQHLGPDTLGAYRLQELNTAMAALGVTDYVRLGGDGKYHDSGMERDGLEILPQPDRVANAFWDADLLEAALDMVSVIRSRRPHVLITYNPFGGYGHPDHIQAHRVAMYAAALAGTASYRRDLGEVWQVPRVLWGTFAAEDMKRVLEAAAANGHDLGWQLNDDELPPMVAATSDIAAHVPTGPWLEKKKEALSAYRSQVDMNDPWWSMLLSQTHPDELGECYLLASGVPYPEHKPTTDLLAGLDLS